MRRTPRKQDFSSDVREGRDRALPCVIEGNSNGGYLLGICMSVLVLLCSAEHHPAIGRFDGDDRIAASDRPWRNASSPAIPKGARTHTYDRLILFACHLPRLARRRASDYYISVADSTVMCAAQNDACGDGRCSCDNRCESKPLPSHGTTPSGHAKHYSQRREHSREQEERLHHPERAIDTDLAAGRLRPRHESGQGTSRDVLILRLYSLDVSRDRCTGDPETGDHMCEVSGHHSVSAVHHVWFFRHCSSQVQLLHACTNSGMPPELGLYGVTPQPLRRCWPRAV